MYNRIYNPALFSLRKLRVSGVNSESTLQQNRSLMLSLVKDRPGITRKELAQITGLKPATITIAINDFLEAGLIEKTGFTEGDSGRRLMGFRFVQDRFLTIAVRLNVSYLAIGLYNIKTENLFIKKIFMDTLKDIEATCEVITREIEQIKPLTDNRQIIGIGVAVEGPFILNNGYYKLIDPKRPSGYFDLGDYLSKKTGIPVIINRENNFSAYTIWKEANLPNKLGIIVCITISYEVDCGIIINGEIAYGENGTSGLFGNLGICFDDQNNIIPLVEKISSNATLKRVHELIGQYHDSILVAKINDLNIRDVIKAYYLNDALALAVFNEVAVYLGRAVSIIINLLNPTQIVIEDEIPFDNRFLESVKKEVKKHIFKAIDPNITVDMSRSQRLTQLDTTLMGACYYITDAYIDTKVFE